MPIVGGPTDKNRELLLGVILSQALYAVSAWMSALELRKNRDALDRLQRRVLLRLISGYGGYYKYRGVDESFVPDIAV